MHPHGRGISAAAGVRGCALLGSEHLLTLPQLSAAWPSTLSSGRAAICHPCGALLLLSAFQQATSATGTSLTFSAESIGNDSKGFLRSTVLRLSGSIMLSLRSSIPTLSSTSRPSCCRKEFCMQLLYSPTHREHCEGHRCRLRRYEVPCHHHRLHLRSLSHCFSSFVIDVRSLHPHHCCHHYNCWVHGKSLHPHQCCHHCDC